MGKKISHSNSTNEKTPPKQHQSIYNLFSISQTEQHNEFALHRRTEVINTLSQLKQEICSAFFVIGGMHMDIADNAVEISRYNHEMKKYPIPMDKIFSSEQRQTIKKRAQLFSAAQYLEIKNEKITDYINKYKEYIGKRDVIITPALKDYQITYECIPLTLPSKNELSDHVKKTLQYFGIKDYDQITSLLNKKRISEIMSHYSKKIDEPGKNQKNHMQLI